MVRAISTNPPDEYCPHKHKDCRGCGAWQCYDTWDSDVNLSYAARNCAKLDKCHPSRLKDCTDGWVKAGSRRLLGHKATSEVFNPGCVKQNNARARQCRRQ